MTAPGVGTFRLATEEKRTAQAPLCAASWCPPTPECDTTSRNPDPWHRRPLNVYDGSLMKALASLLAALAMAGCGGGNDQPRSITPASQAGQRSDIASSD